MTATLAVDAALALRGLMRARYSAAGRAVDVIYGRTPHVGMGTRPVLAITVAGTQLDPARLAGPRRASLDETTAIEVHCQSALSQRTAEDADRDALALVDDVLDVLVEHSTLDTDQVQLVTPTSTTRTLAWDDILDGDAAVPAQASVWTLHLAVSFRRT